MDSIENSTKIYLIFKLKLYFIFEFDSFQKNWDKGNEVWQVRHFAYNCVGKWSNSWGTTFLNAKMHWFHNQQSANLEKFRNSIEIFGKELKLTLNACKHRSLRWHCIKTFFFLCCIYGFWNTSENQYHLTEFKMSPTSLGLTQSGKVCCGVMCPYLKLSFHFFFFK